MGLRAVVDLLRCPHCAGALMLADGTAGCDQGHRFDVARQGYLNLLPGDAVTATADTAAMVDARSRFLDAGHYTPVTTAITAALAQAAGPGAVIDVGAGTGHHLAAALDVLPDRVGVALDLSRHAARRAARAHPRIGAVVCDAWQPLPLRDAAAGAVLCAFAPRDAAEIARVLAPGGALVLVTPTQQHLQELIGPLGLVTVDPRKQERLAAQLTGFHAEKPPTTCATVMALHHSDLAALAGMGPSAHHTDPAQLADAIAALPQPMAVTASVSVAVMRPRNRC